MIPFNNPLYIVKDGEIIDTPIHIDRVPAIGEVIEFDFDCSTTSINYKFMSGYNGYMFKVIAVQNILRDFSSLYPDGRAPCTTIRRIICTIIKREDYIKELLNQSSNL